MRRALIAPALALAAALPLPVRATNCTAIAGSIAFGTYDTVQASANDTSGNLQVTCVPGVGDPLTTPYIVTLAGTGSANDAVRSLGWLSHRLYYQLYRDAGRTSVWGNGSTSGAGVAGSVTSTATFVAASRVHTAYARMPALQAVPAAPYVGTLQVTIEY